MQLASDQSSHLSDNVIWYPTSMSSQFVVSAQLSSPIMNSSSNRWKDVAWHDMKWEFRKRKFPPAEDFQEKTLWGSYSYIYLKLEGRHSLLKLLRAPLYSSSFTAAQNPTTNWHLFHKLPQADWERNPQLSCDHGTHRQMYLDVISVRKSMYWRIVSRLWVTVCTP